MSKKDRIEAGKLINTHGIAGEVKVEVWLDSPKFMKSFRRFYIGEKEYKVLSSRIQKGFLYLTSDIIFMTPSASNFLIVADDMFSLPTVRL